MKPVLSLVIPTYNCIDYLSETIDSVIPQLSEDFELILVDDGSDDGTAEKLAALCGDFDYSSKSSSPDSEKIRYADSQNIKILLRGHEGPSAARNAGIEAASGKWIAFMDCDDVLMDGFFRRSRKVLEEEADLYIFSFERVDFLNDSETVGDDCPGSSVVSCGEGGACSRELVTPFIVLDKTYASTSDFADDYIRTRHLLVYSACNKFYRKDLLDKHGIRFRSGMEFGEDRLFNYDYLRLTGGVATSSVCMFRYMQRNPDSASKRYYPDYYNTIMMLHRAKMDCFLTLSRGTTEEEKKAFEEYDLAEEKRRMAERK